MKLPNKNELAVKSQVDNTPKLPEWDEELKGITSVIEVESKLKNPNPGSIRKIAKSVAQRVTQSLKSSLLDRKKKARQKADFAKKQLDINEKRRASMPTFVEPTKELALALFKSSTLWVIYALILLVEVINGIENVGSSGKIVGFLDKSLIEQGLYVSGVIILLVFAHLGFKLITEKWRRFVGLVALLLLLVTAILTLFTYASAFSPGVSGGDVAEVSLIDPVMDGYSDEAEEARAKNARASKLFGMGILMAGLFGSLIVSAVNCGIWASYSNLCPSPEHKTLVSDAASLTEVLADCEAEYDMTSEELRHLDDSVEEFVERCERKLIAMNEAHFGG